MQGGKKLGPWSLCCARSSLQRLSLHCSAVLGAELITPPPAPGVLSQFLICLMIDSYFLQLPAQQRSPTSANGIFCGSVGVKAEATSPYWAHHLQLRDNVLFLPRSSHLPNSVTGWVDSSILDSLWDFLLSFRFSSALLVLVGVRRREGRICNWWQNSLQPIAIKASPGWAEHLPPFVIIWYGFFCSATSKDKKHVSRLFVSAAPWPSG